jgi:hypothetical protein
MPKNSESAKLAIHANSSNSSIMAFAKVGNGLGQPIADSSRNLHYNSEILLAKHNLQIRGSKGAYN